MELSTLNEAEKDALFADYLAVLNTLTPATAFAEEVRWRMMTDDDRHQVPTHLRFGGGRRLTAGRRRMVLDAAMKNRCDIAYLTFGKGCGPGAVHGVRRTPHRSPRVRQRL